MGIKKQESKMTTNEIAILAKIYKKNPLLNWEEITDIFNKEIDKDYSPSAVRLQIQFGERWLEAQPLTDNDYQAFEIHLRRMDKLELKRKEVLSLGQWYRKQLNEVNKLQDLKETIQEIVKPFEYQKIQPIGIKESDRTTIYVISDLQEDGSGYSQPIFRNVFQQINDNCKKDNVKEIYLLENGDSIEGVLRVSSLYETPQGYVGQTRIYANALANEIDWLTKQGIKINFSIVNSNHTEIRPFGTSRGAIKNEDITILILDFLKALLKNNKNINWLNKDYKEGKDLNFNELIIQGYEIYQAHGDESGANPSNSKQYLNKVNDFQDKKFDFIIASHWHHFVAHSINRLKYKGGNSMVIFTPALDPRMSKTNEVDLKLSSEPAFLKIVIENKKGIVELQLLNTKIYY